MMQFINIVYLHSYLFRQELLNIEYNLEIVLVGLDGGDATSVLMMGP